MDLYIDPSPAPQLWQNVVDASDDAWLFHDAAWIERTAEIFALENRWTLAVEGDRPLGGVAFQIETLRRHGRPFRRAHSIYFGSTGPFAVRGLPAKTRRKVLQSLTDEAVAWARREGLQSLRCALPPLAAASLANIRGVNPLVFQGWRDTSTHVRIAELGSSPEELAATLSPVARRWIKKARKAGYTVERTPWPEALDAYYEIHRETYQRTGVAPHPRRYFALIADAATNGGAVLWMGRDPDGRVIAFHNSARFRDSAFYWTGCCGSAHLDSGINYLLFWEALRGAQQDGCQWYDIGEVFPAERTGKLRGLTDFKSRFGGEIHRYFRGEIRLGDPPGPPLLKRLSRRLVPSRQKSGGGR